MTDYISREAAFQAFSDVLDADFPYISEETPRERIDEIPAADVVEVDEVAKILTWLFADHCPCNYNDIDEWLPCVCELSNECPQPKDEFGCWKQFIKHHKAKMDGGADG